MRIFALAAPALCACGPSEPASLFGTGATKRRFISRMSRTSDGQMPRSARKTVA